VNIMESNFIPDTASARVLNETNLDTVVAGIAASQAWVSPMAIHGFNPQPDPPAFGNVQALGSAAHA
jgi:hypothetical protein